jgi:hypothetical protein
VAGTIAACHCAAGKFRAASREREPHQDPSITDVVVIRRTTTRAICRTACLRAIRPYSCFPTFA